MDYFYFERSLFKVGILVEMPDRFQSKLNYLTLELYSISEYSKNKSDTENLCLRQTRDWQYQRLQP